MKCRLTPSCDDRHHKGVQTSTDDSKQDLISDTVVARPLLQTVGAQGDPMEEHVHHIPYR